MLLQITTPSSDFAFVEDYPTNMNIPPFASNRFQFISRRVEIFFFFYYFATKHFTLSMSGQFFSLISLIVGGKKSNFPIEMKTFIESP